MATPSILPAQLTFEVPILPLRNFVLFPAAVVPVNIGRPRSSRLVEDVCSQERPLIGVITQKDPQVEDPEPADLYTHGTLARILKVIRLNSGNYSVVLQGVCRMQIERFVRRNPFYSAEIRRFHETPVRNVELEALGVHLQGEALSLFRRTHAQNTESLQALENVREPGALSDLIASTMTLPNDIKQKTLEQLDIRERVRMVLDMVSRQLQVLSVKDEVQKLVREEMSETRRQDLLRQQMKEIKRELGEQDDEEEEIEAFRERIAKSDLPPEVEKEARRQIGRMTAMNASGSEYQVVRTYVEWILDLPWNKSSSDRLDIGIAQELLDNDHYGLEQAKKRIIQYIAIRRLRPDGRSPILCFVGPPGVGKTSLAKSIAKACDRRLERVSLGGVREEAEIRGHRRTYIGSYPGRIIGALKRAGTKNPVIVLDEIDKMSEDQMGSPASALLEVLDPEQNNAFVDHYLDLPFDLSQVMFIATANRKGTIPYALLDRMEIIELSGYTHQEKQAIARDFLIPKQLNDHGLSPTRLEFDDASIRYLVDRFTDEPGVRKLDQLIASTCRHVALRLAAAEDLNVVTTPAFIDTVLGAPRVKSLGKETNRAAGHATGLASTHSGGKLVHVEASRMPGKGLLHLTGNMGDVLKETVHTAFTLVRSKTDELGLPHDFLEKIDVHVHLPGSYIPRDGVSAGLPLYIALVSMLTRIAVNPEIAMMGEVTLRGRVLKVEGVKEKCLAAHQAGIKTVFLPKQNQPELDEIPASILSSLDLRLISSIDEAFQQMALQADAKIPFTESLGLAE